MEALKRYHSGGEQKLNLPHVIVNKGGQAIVGAVSPAPAPTEQRKIGRRPHERQARHIPQPAARRCVKADTATVLGPGSHRPETVCRFHGARGGGRKGASNGAYRDRLHTAEAVAERRALAALLRRARTRVAGLGDGRRGQAPRQGSAGRLPAVPS